MKEYKEYADRTHILNKENVEVEQTTISQCTHIGKLIAYYLMWYRPSYKDACKESYDRKEQLTCDKVEEVEDVHAKQVESLPRS